MPHDLWVTSQDSSVLFIGNFADLSPINQINLPSRAEPHLITFHSPVFAYVGGTTDRNVYVIDASTHVTNGGFNPVLTILANAYRASNNLLKAWKGSKAVS
jgi:hypothetical protein